jgi:hypothetical protein
MRIYMQDMNVYIYLYTQDMKLYKLHQLYKLYHHTFGSSKQITQTGTTKIEPVSTALAVIAAASIAL